MHDGVQDLIISCSHFEETELQLYIIFFLNVQNEFRVDIRLDFSLIMYKRMDTLAYS